MKFKSIKRFTYKILLLIPGADRLVVLLFNILPHDWKEHFYDMVAYRPPLLYRTYGVRKISAWGREYKLLLTPSEFSLRWNLLFSFGHDIEVRNIYKKILLTGRPRVSRFIDVGANYGLHSMIFLAWGVDTVMVEPNPLCKKFILETLELNKFSATLVDQGLGDDQVQCGVLSWREGSTWLGKVVYDNQSIQAENQSIQVSLVTLDSIAAVNQKNCLIKIDVEGGELAVLRGGAKSIAYWRPLVIFESLDGDGESRSEVYDFFTRIGYRVMTAHNFGKYFDMTKGEFISSKSRNFIAEPLSREVD